MRSLSNLLTAAAVASAVHAHAAMSPSEQEPFQFFTDPQAVVVEVDGQPVKGQELIEFSKLLSTYEGFTPRDGKTAANEYILTKLHKDLYTTIPVESQSEGTSPLKFASQGERQVLRKEFQNWVDSEITVPRSEMEKWYNANVQNYTQPIKVKAYHLFMEISKDEQSSSPEAVRKRMSDVKAQADKGTSFSVLAEKYSEASSGRNGGEIGYITPRMPIGPQSKPMNQVLENALFSLSPGKTSDIVQTTHGLHILYITDKQTTITPTIDDLITSKVLPNAVKQDLLTSEIRKRIETSLAAHKGKVADAPTTGSALTTETIAFYIDEKPVTIQNLEQVYGIRFTRAYQARQGNPEALADLLKQVLEDEGMIRAAIDAGLGAKPETAKELKTVAERGIAARRLQAIISEVYPVNDERVRAEYEATKSDYLVPEADGLILVVNAEATSDPATAARGREKARAAIMKAQADLKAGSSFDNVVKALKAQNLDTTGGEVARHAIGMSPDLNVRAFDQAISMAQDDGQLSDIVPASNGFAVAKLGKRYKGEPTPYERVRQRLRQMVLSKNTDQARDDMVRQLLKSGKAKIHEDKIKAAPKQDNN